MSKEQKDEIAKYLEGLSNEYEGIAEISKDWMDGAISLDHSKGDLRKIFMGNSSEFIERMESGFDWAQENIHEMGLRPSVAIELVLRLSRTPSELAFAMFDLGRKVQFGQMREQMNEGFGSAEESLSKLIDELKKRSAVNE